VNAAGVSYVVAFGGGVISFVSPCVLPIVPAYLSMVTGLDLSEAQYGSRRQLARIVRDTLLFIAGFGVVFVILGMASTALGSAVTRDQILLTRISGGVVLAMSLFVAGSLVLRAPFLYGEARFHPSASRLGPLYAPIAGVAFGFGWTPCLGPVLASVLAVASTDRGIGQGAALLLVYTVGLGVPFLVVGCGFGRLSGALRWVKVRSRGITIASSALLAGFGVLLVLDRLAWLTTQLESWMTAVGLGGLVHAG
jgi:cytochrome c-type biogenesis protein